MARTLAETGSSETFYLRQNNGLPLYGSDFKWTPFLFGPLLENKNFWMYKDSGGRVGAGRGDMVRGAGKPKEQAAFPSGSEGLPLQGKDTADLITEAFSQIKCTVWKAKNLVDRIEEDHPSQRSTEYSQEMRGAKSVSPIGKGTPEKTKARGYMCVEEGPVEQKHVSARSAAGKKEEQGSTAPEGEKAQRALFVEELAAFAKRREISTGGALVCSISKDQEGSRFIQKKLDGATGDEIEYTFQEVKKHINELITDLFGNYVIQKFLEMGTSAHRKDILSSMRGLVIPLSLHMYGCRVIQKALECDDINLEIVAQLKGHVIELVCDQNGNHVIQKCVECVDAGFVIREFEEDAVNLSRHRYGCRVIQRIFEHSTDCRGTVDKIVAKAALLVEDQYGNYVIQHIIEHGTDQDRRRLIKELADRIGEYSVHKFASNVMEKCVLFGSEAERRHMLGKVVAHGPNSVAKGVCMAGDKFGNYVIQRMLEVLADGDREKLFRILRSSLADLKKSTYSKCIVSKLGI